MAVLRGEEAALTAPGSYSAALDVMVAAKDNPRRGLAAALGLCWPVFNRKQRRRMGEDHPWAPLTHSLASHNFNALAFGGAVLDEITERGCTLEEFSIAGAIALDMLTDLLPESDDEDVPDVDEVTAVADFSEAPEPSTT